MSIFFLVLGTFALLVSVLLYSVAASAIHEILAVLIFIVFVVCLIGAKLTEELVRIRKAVEDREAAIL